VSIINQLNISSTDYALELFEGKPYFLKELLIRYSRTGLFL